MRDLSKNLGIIGFFKFSHPSSGRAFGASMPIIGRIVQKHEGWAAKIVYFDKSGPSDWAVRRAMSGLEKEGRKTL